MSDVPHVRPKIPKPRVVNGAIMFVEAEADNWLRLCAGLEPLPIDPKAPIRLIHLSTLADRHDCHRRTIRRAVEQAYGRLSGTEAPSMMAGAAKRALKSV